MKSVLGIIIAFDNDNDLRELTEHRTVAAVQWGGRILSEASLKHVVTDRNVVVRNGRTMMGDENYPITIAKNSTI